jgi:hypothetical protein
MKVLILLMLMPLTVLAFPNVGDFVQYEAKYEDDVVIQRKKIISYDEVRDSFQIGYIVSFKGRILEQVVYDTSRSFIYSKDKVLDVLKNCQIREGALSDYDIQGKIVKACEFYDEPSQLSYMIGMVPFGSIRFQTYLGNEEFLDFYITKFEMGPEHNVE